MTYFLKNLKNKFDFFLRNNITFSRKNYIETPCSLNDINFSLKQKEFYQRLTEKYDCTLFDRLNTRNFLENLYFLNIFDKYFSNKSCTEISVLDIGSKNWSYVRSEYLFFSSISSNVHLDGIELDAYRLNCNFFSRYEIAQFYKNNLPNTEYYAGDFLEHKQKYDRIIWILPFITEYPLIKWGLPLKYFEPDKMLLHAYNMLNKGGELLIVNQGESEAEIQRDLLQKNNIPVSASFEEAEDVFELFKNKRFCFKTEKP